MQAPDRSADGIGVFDTIQMKLVKVIHAGTDPEQLEVSKDGKQLFVANEDAATASIVDVASGRIVGVVKVGGEPEGVERTPDGAFVYVTSEEDNEVFVMIRQRATSWRRSRRRHARDRLAFCRMARAYVTSETGNAVDVLDTRDHRVLTTIGYPTKMPASDGRCGRSRWESNLCHARTRKERRHHRHQDQRAGVDDRSWRPAVGIAISPDGRRLYMANGPSNDVSIVDVATHSVVARVKAGDSPWGAVFVP